jgi:hypothetical protein
MTRLEGIVAFAVGALVAAPTAAQEFFRCTSPDGKVTYQQAPCPKADAERRIDATPANTDYDPAQRERVLKQGEEASRRLEERAAREREEARLREEERRREEQREREAQAREAAREVPAYFYPWPGMGAGSRPPRPLPPARPQPLPSPQPRGK